MKTLITKTLTASLIKIVSLLTNAELVQVVKGQVASYLDADMPGEEKKAEVKRELKELRGEIAEIVADTAGSLVNLAIEAALAYLLARQK